MRVFTPCADATVCHHAQAALDAFHLGAWDEADAHLQALLARCPGDAAALHLQGRVAEARALPPGIPWSPAVALDKL